MGNLYVRISDEPVNEEDGVKRSIVMTPNDSYLKADAGADHEYHAVVLNKKNIGEDKFIAIKNTISLMLADKTGQVTDGYHSFDELYEFRKAYNAILFNEWASVYKYDVHKSYKHSDGEDCFGGGWFVVSAQTPFGQITNHYRNEDWDLFEVEIKEKANEWDGHTPKEALERLLSMALAYSTNPGKL